MSQADNYPKVLVAIPTYSGKDYIFKENFAAVTGFNYPNYTYIYIDNTNNNSYVNTLRRRGARAVRVPRGPNSRQALANAQNYARKKCLDEGYDYLLFVESDLVPPVDTIQRLLNHIVDNKLRLCGATYFIGHEVKVPCVFYTVRREGSNAVETKVIHPSMVENFLGKGLQKVHGMGLGCTMIRRDLVEKYPFWHDERFENKHSDVYFYMQLWNDQVPVYVDSSFVVEHHPSRWELVKDR